MPRYVILRHELPPGTARPVHWDLMLEAGPDLRTWALAEPPAAGQAIRAEPLPAHRLAYLAYEGPVSGERGTVTGWDAGTFAWQHVSDNEVLVRLHGRRLCGVARLRRAAADSPHWEFLFTAAPAPPP